MFQLCACHSDIPQYNSSETFRNVPLLLSHVCLCAVRFDGYFVGWVKEIYGTYFVYHFEGSSDVNKELVDYRPTLIPNGYTEFYSDTTEDTIIVVYANEEGEMLKFSYSHNPDNTTWFVGADSLTVQPITINGISGEAITSTEQGAATAIMWITTENTAFNISGFLSVEDLIAMAESLYEK